MSGLILPFLLGCVTLRLPGRPFVGDAPPFTSDDLAVQARLQDDVSMLATTIGERHLGTHGDALQKAADWIAGRFEATGYTVGRECFPVGGQQACNLVAEVPGGAAASEVVVVGAHYDSAEGTPAADDNGSGVAALLHLAGVFHDAKPSRTLRFVAFANEEPPHFWTETMGSLVYARACRARSDNVVAMLSLESIGYYSDAPGSQGFPFPLSLFYPKQGNFLAFVANVSSRRLLAEVGRSFRETATVPSQGAAVPEKIVGVGWSDQWSFWQVGYPGVMVTDTAIFRNPNYHHPTDTPDTLDGDRFTRVVRGLEQVVRDLGR